MKRTRITTKCVADQHVEKHRERVIEFFDPETHKGGLISFRRADDGNLTVEVYRVDPGVIVLGGAA